MVSDMSDPSRSQGPNVPLMANHSRENEGLQPADYDGRDAPQVYDPESEGLQSVDYDGRNGPQVVDPPPFSTGYSHTDDTKAEPTVYADELSPVRRGRRKWIWILVAVVIAVAVAVGVGAGVGLTRSGGGNDSKSSESSESTADSSHETDSEDAPPTSTSPSSTTTSASSTSSTVSSSVQTSGMTGLADFVCANDTTAISAAGISYVEECNVYYQTNKNMEAPDSSKWLKNLPGSPVTTYSFTDCIDECDDYNSNNKPSDTDKKCYGVSYYANLTSAFRGSWGGNCFLKNGRGTGTYPNATGDDADHTASAYRHCLQAGTPVDCD